MMAKSELYQKGAALRRQLLGDAAVERSAREIYSDPVMKKFIDMATETVFGALWTRPGLDLKTRALVCVVSDAAAGREPELGLHLRMALRQVDRRGTDRSIAAPLGLCRCADHPRRDDGGYKSLCRVPRRASGGKAGEGLSGRLGPRCREQRSLLSLPSTTSGGISPTCWPRLQPRKASSRAKSSLSMTARPTARASCSRGWALGCRGFA